MSKIRSAERISDLIREKILAKELFPGSQIVEDELARTTGVSRAVVRNAMIELQKEGFVTIVPNKGSFVTNPRKKEVASFYQVRRHLEIGVGELAIKNITDIQIAQLEENYARQLELLDNFSIEEYAILNRNFHWVIVETADNEFYTKYLRELYNLQRLYILFFDKSRNNENSLENHRKILDGLKERDFEKYKEGVIADCDLSRIYGESFE
ncbi:MAG: GntR family transcriptional regulator [Eubacterium sp.]|nr:GntR family transcriptional regulator [Eubacterium sp.]